jgi:hypothetical protein
VSGANAPSEPRSRGSVVAELLILTGAALLAVFWIIPSQVSGGGLGLDPGFLPRLCAVAIGILVFLDGVRRLLGRSPQDEAYASGWSALILIGGLALLGAVAIRFASIAVAAVLVIPIGMVLLGERRPLLIALTTALVAGSFLLFQR